MGLITSFTEAFLGRSSQSQFLGANRKYKANQSDKDFSINEGYLTSSDIYAITNKIANTGANIPVVLKLNDEVVNDGELFDLIHNPNDYQTRKEYVLQGIINKLISGNVYFNNVSTVGLGKPFETHLLYPQLVDIKTLTNSFHTYSNGYEYTLNGKTKTFTNDEITHIKNFNPTVQGLEELYGLSPLVAGYLTLVGLNNNNIASASILENQGASGILTSKHEYPLTGGERKEQQSILDGLLGGAGKFGKIVQGSTDASFIRLGLDPTQLKIIESKIMKVRDICNIYDVPSVMFNDPSNRTHNNMSSAEKYFINNPVMNNLIAFYDGYEKSVVSKFNTDKQKYKISFDLSNIDVLKEDNKKQAETDKLKMDAINLVVNMNVSDTAKIELLMTDFNYTDEQAKTIVL